MFWQYLTAMQAISFLKKVDPDALENITGFGNCQVMHFKYENHSFKLIEII